MGCDGAWLSVRKLLNSRGIRSLARGVLIAMNEQVMRSTQAERLVTRGGIPCHISTLDVWGIGLAIGVLVTDILDRALFGRLVADIPDRVLALLVRALLIIFTACFITVIWRYAYICRWCSHTLVSGACDEAIMRFLEYTLRRFYLTGEVNKDELIASGVKVGLDEHMAQHLLNELVREDVIRLRSESCGGSRYG